MRDCAWRAAAAVARAWAIDSLWLAGYLAGAVMHLALDIAFNGRLTPKNIFAFYSFGYRLAHRFDAEALFGSTRLIVPESFWRSFFLGARIARPRVRRGTRSPSVITGTLESHAPDVG